MTDRDTVWIGEAWNVANERLERVVHINEKHARHDIEMLAGDYADRITVTEERVRHASGELPEDVV
jgi:hypothetical protein